MKLTESAKVCAAQELCSKSCPLFITAQAAVVEAGVCPECGGNGLGPGTVHAPTNSGYSTCTNPYHDALEALDALGGSDE